MFRNLKKAQDSVFRTEKEIKDTAKEVDDLTAELKNLEEKATEVIKSTNAAEVRQRGEKMVFEAVQRLGYISALRCKHSVG